MTLSLSTLGFLTSEAGSLVLSRLATEDLAEDHTLRLLTSLRRSLTPEQAGASLELARLRRKAVAKFGSDASRMFFTREALEQASDPLVRKYRVLGTFPGQRIVDACCSIGADALAYAQAGGDVLGLDIDPVRVEMARLNAQALGISNARFEVADVRDGVPEADLIFFDPARRDSNGRRIFDVERYQPPLSVIRGWQAAQIVVKLSPGVELAQLQAYRGLVAFVSVEGELKEALLRYDATIGKPNSFLAVLLAGSAEFPLIHEKLRIGDNAPVAPVTEPLAWLVEPDPSVIRAGLVADLAQDFGGALLDSEIAYITTDQQPHSPWARSWRILDWMPFNLKKLRVYLREQGVGHVTVKKRGTAVTPEEVLAKLKLNGSGSRTIVLTRCRGEHIMLVCEDLMIEQAG